MNKILVIIITVAVIASLGYVYRIELMLTGISVLARSGEIAPHREVAWSQPEGWPALLESPIFIDKTVDMPYEEGDEYIYWPN